MLTIIIPGFGPPHLDHKQTLFAANIAQISKTFSGKQIVVQRFWYSAYPATQQNDDKVLQEKDPRITIHNTCEKKGIIGEFIFKYVHPTTLKNTKNIIILLDDIELLPNFQTDLILREINDETKSWDIVSPTLTPSSKISHQGMVTQQINTQKIPFIKRVMGIELFCYVMTLTGYKKFYGLLNAKSRWLWGLDLIQDICKIQVGLINTHHMHHHYSSADSPENKKNRRTAFLEMIKIVFNYKLKLSSASSVIGKEK